MFGSEKIIGFGLLQAMVWAMPERLQPEKAEDVEDSTVVLPMRSRCPFIVRGVPSRYGLSEHRMKKSQAIYSASADLRCA